MRNLLIAFAIAGTASGPALAQVVPAPNAAPEAKVKTVKKVVCKRVEEELGTGSRLGAPGKICKEVEVPAPAAKESGNHGNHKAGS